MSVQLNAMKQHYKLYPPGSNYESANGWAYEYSMDSYEGSGYCGIPQRRKTGFSKREEVEQMLIDAMPPGAVYSFTVKETYSDGSYSHERDYLGFPKHEGVKT